MLIGKTKLILAALAVLLTGLALSHPALGADTDVVFSLQKTGGAYTVADLDTAWRTEVPEQTKYQYVGRQNWQQVFVDNWIQVAVMAAGAQAGKLQDSPEFTMSWRIRESSLLAGKYFEKVIAPELSKISATDDEIKAFYEQNKNKYYFTGWREDSQIVVESQDKADALYAQLSKDPSGFAEAAKQNSMDIDTKDQGGALGHVTAKDERVPPEAMPAYLETPVGQISKPVQSRLGWHLVYVTGASKPEEDYQPFSPELAEAIRTSANGQKQQAEALRLITGYKEQAGLTVNQASVSSIARDWLKDMKQQNGLAADEPDNGTPLAPDTVVATLTKSGISVTLAEVDYSWTNEMDDNFKAQIIAQQDWQAAFLDRWMEVVTLADLARQKGLDKEPDFVTLAKVKRDSLLATMFFEAKVAPELDKLSVSPEDVTKWYDENKEQYLFAGWREASHILVKSKEEIDAIYATLQKEPGKFADIAKEKSIDPGSKDKGGALGRIKKGQFVPEAEQAVFTTPAGKMSPPVQSQFGWHIFSVTAASDPKDDIMPLTDELKQQIQARLLTEKRRAAFMDRVAADGKELGVTVNEQAVPLVALKWAEDMQKKMAAQGQAPQPAQPGQ